VALSGLIGASQVLSAIADAGAPPDQGGFGTNVPNYNNVLALHNRKNWKDACRVATITNVNVNTGTGISVGDTIDGDTLIAGERVLVKNQFTAAENGIWVVAASGAPSRALDFSTSAHVIRAIIPIERGTQFSVYVCVNTAATIGVTGLNFTDFYTALGTVGNLNLDQMPAHTTKGNPTGSLASPVDMTASQLRLMLSSPLDTFSYATRVPFGTPPGADRFLSPASADAVAGGDGRWPFAGIGQASTAQSLQAIVMSSQADNTGTYVVTWTVQVNGVDTSLTLTAPLTATPGSSTPTLYGTSATITIPDGSHIGLKEHGAVVSGSVPNAGYIANIKLRLL
jgi:hypothetical protein